MLRFIPLLILIVLLVSFAISLLRPADKADLRRRVIPAIDLPDLFSPKVNINVEEWKGRYVLLNVFASWCGPCKIEHGYLMKLSESSIPIYGLAWRDNEKSVREFLANSNPYKRVAVDVAGEVGVSLGITGVPESFLIDPNGIMILHYVGPLNEEIWAEKFAKFFKEKK